MPSTRQIATGQASGVATGSIVNASVSASAAIALSKLQASTIVATFSPGDPASTVSATRVMMGLGSTVTYTPTKTGKLLVIFKCQVANNTGGDQVIAHISYGTGTAPVNGAAPAGTRLGGGAYDIFYPGTVASGALSFLTAYYFDDSANLNTATWFDAAMGTNGAGTASMSDVWALIVELL